MDALIDLQELKNFLDFLAEKIEPSQREEAQEAIKKFVGRYYYSKR